MTGDPTRPGIAGGWRLDPTTPHWPRWSGLWGGNCRAMAYDDYGSCYMCGRQYRAPGAHAHLDREACGNGTCEAARDTMP